MSKTRGEGSNNIKGYKPCNNERGVSMLEYALLASLIAVVAISSISALGWAVYDTSRDVSQAFAAAGIE